MRSHNMNNTGIELVEDSFGCFKDKDKGICEPVRRFTLSNKNGMTVQIITYGAAITAIKFPDKEGKEDDVVLGFDDLDGYRGLKGQNPYMGAVVGRVANRIGNASFRIGENSYTLSKNVGEHHLHGGFKGFDKAIWESHVEGTKVTMSYLSKDGEEGYPGEVMAHVTYQLTPQNELIVGFKATATKPTPVSLTNHAYFNLAGHASGSAGLYDHQISINGDKYTPLNDDLIVTGETKSVGGSIFDLRIARRLGDVINDVPGGGYDVNYCINGNDEGHGRRFVARVCHPPTGRVMEVCSDQPGVQFYTSNYFPDDDSMPGKDKVNYHKHGAFCLETQKYPNAVNIANFPETVVTPGVVYMHNVLFRFSLATS